MKLSLADKKHESGDVWSFFFDVNEPLEWRAGQSIRLEIPRKTLGCEERRFTIASAPSEKLIRITTRLSESEFKRNLDGLQIGQTVHGYNIEGDFVWNESEKPTLFLAAGIGITPFRSILAEHTEAREKTQLLYSTRDIPPVFGQELRHWLGNELHIIPNRISFDVIRNLISDWQKRIVYISGPEKMVYDLYRQLLKAELPETQLRTDHFTGID